MHQSRSASSTTSTGHQRRWLALTVLLIPAALTLLSVTSVNVALPAIREGLGASTVAQSLVLTLYALSFALVLLPAGRIGDRYGHKRVFVAGVTVFTIASLWCGVAPDVTQLVVARILAGIGGGLAMTPVSALIQLLFHGPERAKPFGIMGAVFGAASAVGPILGGFLIDAGGDIGWRLVFLVNVPFGVLAILLAVFVLPETPPRGEPGSDWFGLTLFTTGILLTILPFSLGSGLSLNDLWMLVGGLLLVAGFIMWERRRDRLGRFAVVPIQLLKQRALLIGIATTFFGFAGFTGSFLLFALLWQDALGHSALSSGLLVAPYAIGSVITAVNTQRFTKRFGVRIITAGLTMIIIGILVIALFIWLLEPEDLTIWLMTAPMLVIGLGVGLFVGPNTNASFVQTEGKHAGVASALVTAAQRCGTAVGIGVLSTLYATLAGGPTSLTVQAIAAVVTAMFAVVAVILMLITRRSRMIFDGQTGV